MKFQNNIIFRTFRLLEKAFGRYKRQVMLMTILAFLSGILEGVGINAIIPLFSFVTGGQASPDDIISKSISNFFSYFHLDYTVRYLLIFIAILFIIKAFLSFFTQYISIKITSNYEKNTRSELFKLLLGSNWPYLSKQKVGYFDQILTTDINYSSALLSHICLIILIVASLIVYSLLAINISFIIAMLAIIFGGVIFFMLKPLFSKNRIASAEITKKYKQLAHYVNEDIIGMKTIKSMIVENNVFQRGVKYFDDIKNSRTRVETLKNVTNISLQPIALFFILGIFAFFYKTNNFNFASFAVIVYAINKVFTYIQMMQAEVHIINSAEPHLRSVLNFKEEALKQKEQNQGVKNFNFKNNFEFKNVWFAYDAHNEVLSGVNFSIKKGSMTGLIGSSGGGKTTIVDLILSLLRPQKGKILLDGEDVLNIKIKEWRKNMGYVSQDIFLTTDSVANNIKFYDDSISDEDMISAAKMANIYEFIQGQPEKFETMVGERGMRLSVGQRQRIILARVLARKPQILILDEATSALDNESEILIQKAIEELKGRVTVIAIAHRLSTIVNFDKLLVLDKGKIIEQGSPRELLKDRESYFSRIYNLKK